MTESRCPFRMKGFDQPDTCDEKCAWLMRVIDYDQRNSRVCAMSVIAMRDEMNEWVPANIIDVCANDEITAVEFDALDEHAQALERENAKQRNHVDNLAKELKAVYNALARAEHDNATLREKLGRMLDNAHEITRIGGDC